MFVFIQNLSATHIVGGEMNYRCLGGSQYEITLTVYRDCETSVVLFDDPAIIGIYDGNNVAVQTLNVPLKNESMLNATLADSCLVAPPSACIMQAIYIDTVTLPVIAQGYVISYQRCCRNNTIVNILGPGQTGATYFIEITETALLSCNSSPVFRDLPNIYLCQGEPLVFDHSVVDLDGDSIVYELCYPYSGASPAAATSNSPPPYSPVIFNTPFSVSAMLGTTDSLKIDASTGILTGTPYINGVFLVGVCAKEYRNGVLLSTTIRDFQYKVGACQPASVAQFDQSFHNCDDLEYQFFNTSTLNVGGYFWDFNGLGTSTAANPIFTFPNQGIYTITLIAGAGTPCADTTVGTIDVQIRTIDLSISPPQLVCAGDTVKIGVVDQYASITGPSTYSWGPANQIISGQGSDSVTIVASNNLTVFVSGVNSHSCQNSAITTITTLNKNVTYDTLRPICNTSLTVDFQNPFSSNPALTDYRWDFDGLGTSTAIHPSFTFPDTGKYDVVLLVGPTATTCADTFYVHVDLELSGLDLTPLNPLFPLCGGDSLWLKVENSFKDYSGATIYNWTPNAMIAAGQGTDSVLIIGQQDATIKVYIENSYGCADSLQTMLNVTTVQASFDTVSVRCNTSLIVPFQNTSITNPTNNNYRWVFDTLGTSTAINPTYTFPDTGWYTIQLIAGTTSIPGLAGLCQDTATLALYLPLEGIDLQAIAPISGCTSDSIHLKAVDLLDVYSSSTQYVWTSTGSPILAGQGTDSIFLMPNQTTTVSLIATNNYGCSDTISTIIDVTNIQAGFTPLLDPCNTTFDVDFQNATNTNLLGINYHWDFGGLGTSTGVNPTHSFPDTGIYTVTLIAGVGNVCVDTISSTVQVVLQGVDLQAIAPQTICNDGLANLKAIDRHDAYSSTTQYTWTVSNGNLLTGQGTDSILVDPNPNSSTVSVLATNNYGCSDTTSTTIQVDVVEASFDSLELPCNTSLVIPFVNTSTTNLAGVNYHWDFGGLGTSVGVNPTYTFPDTGAYTVTLIAGQTGQCTDTMSMDVYLPLEGIDLQIMPSQTICEGDSTWFRVTDLLAAYSSSIQYTWNSTATILDGQGTDSVLVMATSNSNLAVVATNNHGCSDTTTADLNVLIVHANFELDTVLCNTSLTVDFRNRSTTNPQNNLYEWDFDGLGTSTGIDPSFTFPDTGIYTISLVAGLGNICPDTLVQTIDLKLDGLVLQNLLPITVCQGDTVGFRAIDQLDAYSNTTQYLWEPTASIVSGQGTDSILLVPMNSLQLEVVATNNWGCSDSTFTTVDVRIVEAAFDSIDLDCSLNLEVPFQNTSFVNTGTTAYAWRFDNLGTSTQENPTYTFPDTGVYTIRLIADAGLLCPDTVEQHIHVELKGLEITATNAQVFCARDTALLVATNLYEGYSNFTTYDWEPSHLILSGQGTDSTRVTIPSNTTFTIIGTNAFGCKDTTQATGTIQYPTPTLAVTVSPDSIFVGQTADLSATDDLNYNYFWTPDTTLSAYDVYDPVARPRVTTTYYLTVENEYGCQNNDSVTVIIRQPICDGPLVFIPSAFSPDGDGHNDVLMVNGNNIESMTMVIFNRWGQKVFETNDQNRGWDGTFKGKELAPDAYGYYMRCTCKQGGELQLKGSITLLR